MVNANFMMLTRPGPSARSTQVGSPVKVARLDGRRARSCRIACPVDPQLRWGTAQVAHGLGPRNAAVNAGSESRAGPSCQRARAHLGQLATAQARVSWILARGPRPCALSLAQLGGHETWPMRRIRAGIDTEGIRTPAGRAQWISSPSP